MPGDSLIASSYRGEKFILWSFFIKTENEFDIAEFAFICSFLRKTLLRLLKIIPGKPYNSQNQQFKCTTSGRTTSWRVVEMSPLPNVLFQLVHRQFVDFEISP